MDAREILSVSFKTSLIDILILFRFTMNMIKMKRKFINRNRYNFFLKDGFVFLI